MPGDPVEDFRCRSCDRILTQSDEFDLSTCRDCEWRPVKHLFDEADDGTCRVCGYLENFGALHPVVYAEAADFPRPRSCRRCLHFAHDGRPCPDYVPAYPESKPCRCGWQEAS